MLVNQLAWIDCGRVPSCQKWLVAYAMSVGVVVMVVEFGVN